MMPDVRLNASLFQSQGAEERMSGGGDMSVIQAFAEINEDLKDKADIVEKCQSIINQLGINASDLANEWEAYALNRGAADASQALLTLSSLGALEAVLNKKKSVAATPASSTSSSRKSSLSSSTPAPRRSAFIFSTLPTSEAALRKRLSMDGGPTEGGLMSPPPVPLHKKAALSPANGAPFMSPPASLSQISRGGAPVTSSGGSIPAATPSGVSPTSLQSPPGSIYIDRTNSGQKTSEWNPNLGTRGPFEPSKRTGGYRCDVGVLEGPDMDINLKCRYRYMYTTLEERARAHEKTLIRLQDDLMERASLGEGGEITPVGIPKQETVVVVGRVCCEAAEGRINKASVILEGSRRDCGGFRVKLELREVPAFALFPGQIIAVEGVNSSGFKMVVRRIIEGIPRPLQLTPANKIKEFHHGDLYQGGGALSVMIASGPFTTTDSLEYEPFEDLLKVIAAKKPDVAVLAGPFVDVNHPKLAVGEAEIQGEGEEAETVDYESLFKMRISFYLDALYASNPGLATKIILVPSLQDVFHDHVFPQPPLEDRVPGGVPSPWFEEERLGELGLPLASEADGADRRIFCMSNPAIFTINEVTVGITTNDILLHLSGDEVSLNTGNRLARLAAHLLQQQSFYPLFPPPADGQAQLDLRHADHWRLPITPDVLLLPSKLAPFAKEVCGSVCINPGHMTRSISPGTYAVMHVHPLPLAKLEEALNGGKIPLQHGVAGRTSVEILRI